MKLALNKIHHFDAVVGLRLLPADCIDLTLTSPPYDWIRDYNGTFDPAKFPFVRIAEELYRITAPGGVVLWITRDQQQDCCESGTSAKQMLYFKNIGFNVQTMIVDSISARHRRYCYGMPPQFCFVLSKGRPKAFHPIRDKPNTEPGRIKSWSARNRDGRIRKGKPKEIPKYGRRSHIWLYPTGFGLVSDDPLPRNAPAPMVETVAGDLMLSYSNPGDLILDPMAGLGTTGKVAVKLNRQFIGFERVRKYCDVANDRVRQAFEQKGKDDDKHGRNDTTRTA